MTVDHVMENKSKALYRVTEELITEPLAAMSTEGSNNGEQKLEYFPLEENLIEQWIDGTE